MVQQEAPEMSKSETRHGFQARQMRGGWNQNECGECGMPRTHRVHPQADRGAMGHHGDEDYQTCYDESHWERPVTTNEGGTA